MAAKEAHKQYKFRMGQIKIPVDTLIRQCDKQAVKQGIITRKECELVGKKIAKMLQLKSRIEPEAIHVIRRSLDARKADLFYIYLVEFAISGNLSEAICKKYQIRCIEDEDKEEDTASKAKNPQAFISKPQAKDKGAPPVIVGMGPAGLFCAYMLAKAGMNPVLIERGASVEERKKDVEEFWKTGVLNPQSNVQFGEGGAGTFSDGKLNTLVKDVSGRNRKVLEIFVEHGAPSEILYLQKPHIGTDRLYQVIGNMRKELLRLGCAICFHTTLLDILTEDDGKTLTEIVVSKEGKKQHIPCSRLILATGHSARDTFSMLEKRKFILEPKPFAIGVRMEHSQSLIDENQYGRFAGYMPAADYKLTHQTQNGYGVYSFCMCPGGMVVNASSEPERLAVNGMSDYGRQGRNANSAIVVTVDTRHFPDTSSLAGVKLQRDLEHKAYLAGQGKIPLQLFGDFKEKKISSGVGGIIPDLCGEYHFADLNNVLPEFISESIKESMPFFGRKIKGFDHDEVVLSGIESRTSSPVRIVRNEHLQSNISGVYPCGEGAGYAGGIMSAAMDGLKVASEILSEEL